MYKGENTDLKSIETFIKASFKKLPANNLLYYKDQDEDHITISCNEDITAMIETTQGIPKIFIEEELELAKKSSSTSEEYEKVVELDKK